MAKAKKKSKAKKSKAKPAKKKAKKSVKRAAAKAKKAPAKSKKTARKAPKKAKKTTAKVKKAAPAPKKKKQIVGEGDYAASRKFLKEQAGFVERNKDQIPAMGKAAEAALDGPEGESLRAAEQEAMNR